MKKKGLLLGLVVMGAGFWGYLIYDACKADSAYLRKVTNDVKKCYQLTISSPSMAGVYAKKGLQVIDDYNYDKRNDIICFANPKELNQLEKELRKIK